MSDPTLTPGIIATTTSYASEATLALDKAAGLIYHDMLAVESTIQTWEASNPTVAPLLSVGLTYAESFLTRSGVPVGAVSLITDDVISACKQMAAFDTSVPSQPVTGSSVVKPST